MRNYIEDYAWQSIEVKNCPGFESVTSDISHTNRVVHHNIFEACEYKKWLVDWQSAQPWKTIYSAQKATFKLPFDDPDFRDNMAVLVIVLNRVHLSHQELQLAETNFIQREIMQAIQWNYYGNPIPYQQSSNSHAQSSASSYEMPSIEELNKNLSTNQVPGRLFAQGSDLMGSNNQGSL